MANTACVTTRLDDARATMVGVVMDVTRSARSSVWLNANSNVGFCTTRAEYQSSIKQAGTEASSRGRNALKFALLLTVRLTFSSVMYLLCNKPRKETCWVHLYPCLNRYFNCLNLASNTMKFLNSFACSYFKLTSRKSQLTQVTKHFKFSNLALLMGHNLPHHFILLTFTTFFSTALHTGTGLQLNSESLT